MVPSMWGIQASSYSTMATRRSGCRSNTPEKIMSHIEVAGRNALVARRLASRTLRATVPALGPWRRVAVCRLNGMSRSAAAAQSDS